MHIEPQPVASTVHVKRFVSFAGNQLIYVALQQAQLNQSRRDHLDRGFMGLVPVSVGCNPGKSGFLGCQHQLVNGFLFRRKLAADRKRTADITGVAVDLAPGIDQYQVAVLEQGVILLVVQDAAVIA